MAEANWARPRGPRPKWALGTWGSTEPAVEASEGSGVAAAGTSGSEWEEKGTRTRTGSKLFKKQLCPLHPPLHAGWELPHLNPPKNKRGIPPPPLPLPQDGMKQRVSTMGKTRQRQCTEIRGKKAICTWTTEPPVLSLPEDRPLAFTLQPGHWGSPLSPRRKTHRVSYQGSHLQPAARHPRGKLSADKPQPHVLRCRMAF